MGRVRPTRRDVADIATGLAAVWALAPFSTGFGAVVLRRYILAIEAAEGTQAMLTRAGALRRQWGLRRRRAGVLVRRVPGTAVRSGDAIEALLGQAASMEAAGLAVTGPADALAPYEEAARQADGHGLFLVLCEAP
jgi:DUF1009 family protein